MQSTVPAVLDAVAATFGDRVLLGRDSVTINSGGEKILAEEVVAAVFWPVIERSPAGKADYPWARGRRAPSCSRTVELPTSERLPATFRPLPPPSRS